jgi:type II secretory pathway pseudopilin PulG
MCNGTNNEKESSYEKGFSYIDLMIAVAILMVGILALVAAMTGAIASTTRIENQLTAKQHATSSLEAIFTARDVNRDNLFGWDRIGNVGDNTIPGGIFLSNPQSIWPTAGADGIIGTADDDADTNGPDGIKGTADDIQPEPGFQRQITITNIGNAPPYTMRRIDVTITYWLGAIQRQETISTFIANYRTTAE